MTIIPSLQSEVSRFVPAFSSRSLPAASPSAPASRIPCRTLATATRSGLFPTACTSRGNAALTVADQQLVRVTHPFHPLFAQRLPCVGRRSNRYGERLLLRARNATVWSVSPQWTDLVSEDPEVVMGNGRALLRFSDLMELADLVGRLSGKSVGSCTKECKDDYATDVKQIAPQRGSDAVTAPRRH